MRSISSPLSLGKMWAVAAEGAASLNLSLALSLGFDSSALFRKSAVLTPPVIGILVSTEVSSRLWTSTTSGAFSLLDHILRFVTDILDLPPDVSDCTPASWMSSSRITLLFIVNPFFVSALDDAFLSTLANFTSGSGELSTEISRWARFGATFSWSGFAYPPSLSFSDFFWPIIERFCGIKCWIYLI